MCLYCLFLDIDCPPPSETPSSSAEDSSTETTTTTDQPIMKPDIVFFGENLADLFHNQMSSDKSICDLLIVIGSSLKVRPVALIPSTLC